MEDWASLGSILAWETPWTEEPGGLQSMGLQRQTRLGSSFGGILELRWGIQASSCVGPGRSNLPFGLRGKAGECSRVTAGQNRPHLGLCPGLNARP